MINVNYAAEIYKRSLFISILTWINNLQWLNYHTGILYFLQLKSIVKQNICQVCFDHENVSCFFFFFQTALQHSHID